MPQSHPYKRALQEYCEAYGFERERERELHVRPVLITKVACLSMIKLEFSLQIGSSPAHLSLSSSRASQKYEYGDHDTAQIKLNLIIHRCSANPLRRKMKLFVTRVCRLTSPRCKAFLQNMVQLKRKDLPSPSPICNLSNKNRSKVLFFKKLRPHISIQ